MLTRRIVENHLVAFEPEAVLPYLAPNVRSLYENRSFIRLAPCTDFVVGYVAQMIIDATESGVRFRKYECLRNIRQIIRSHPERDDLSSNTVEFLFRLYRHYIYSEKEEVQWCVSSYLKDRALSPNQVKWLITNASTSSHLVNRLLRYPKPDLAIVDWAQRALELDLFPDRKAELLGLLIESDLPEFAGEVPIDTILWAIYYSRASLVNKSRLLRSVVTEESAESALTIAMRLRLPEVVRHVASVVRDEDA